MGLHVEAYLEGEKNHYVIRQAATSPLSRDLSFIQGFPNGLYFMCSKDPAWHLETIVDCRKKEKFSYKADGDQV